MFSNNVEFSSFKSKYKQDKSGKVLLNIMIILQMAGQLELFVLI